MDTKKILALTMIVLALFCCIGAASAGLFDFFGGGEVKNQTYTFDGFTLDIPETANVTKTNQSESGVDRQTYRIKIANESDSSKISTVSVTVSKEAVASSKIYKEGLFKIALAIATLCFSPPDNPAPLVPIIVS